MVKAEKKRSDHYVNNKEFSTAITAYISEVKQNESLGKETPQIPEYIGECILKICEGLSRKPNFIRYSFRDEMVMDAVGNCIEKVTKFDRAIFEEKKAKVTSQFKKDLTIEELTQLGKQNKTQLESIKRWYGDWLVSGIEANKPQVPNAFAYFTQIAFYAFLRRIAKEEKQWEIKKKYIETASIEAFADFGMDGNGDSLIAKIRNRNDNYHKDTDPIFDDDAPTKKVSKRGWGTKKKAARTVSTQSLNDFE